MNPNEQSPQQVPQKQVIKRTRNILFWKFLCGIFFILFILSFYGAVHYRRLYSEVSNSSQGVLGKEETVMLVREVSKLMDLPQDEIPTVATVSDPQSLADQKFFLNAKKGDKVLIYKKAQKAILYRQSTGKIIEVAPLSLEGAPDNGGNKPSTIPSDNIF